MLVDWVVVGDYQVDSSQGLDLGIAVFWNITTWWQHTVQLKIVVSWWAYVSFTADWDYMALKAKRKIFGSKWEWIPTELKSIWNLWMYNIFWKNKTNPNYNTFFTWFETNTANTWSITPWNFVWYLDIWGYKIPYYK